MNRICGIDPGMSGSVCVYSPLAGPDSGMRWQVLDLPTVGDKSQKRIVAPTLRDFLTRLDPEHAFIELATVMPKQGIVSSGRYMRAVGAIEAIVACLNIPITFVTPQRWKKFHGLKGSDKEQSRAMAVRKFPEAANLLTRKLDHGRAESMLLAAYGVAVSR